MEHIDELLHNTEIIIQKLEGIDLQGQWKTWIPIIAAILALGGVVYSTRYVKNNIKMNARIEWIQKVRETVAAVISLCYSLAYEDDEKISQSILLRTQEKISLLILYFGPDEVVETDNKNEDKILLNEKSNQGKNDYIVKNLENISMEIERYYTQKYSSRVRMIEFELASLKRKYSLKETEKRYIDKRTGELLAEKDYPEEYYKEEQKLLEEKRKLQNPKELLKDIEKLREIMRIYIKVEWNVTKKGK